MLKNLKIGTRMGVGFSAVLILMLVAFVATFMALQTVEQSTNHVIDESLPFTLLADEMVVSTVQVNQLMTDAALTQNQEAVGEAKTHYQKFKAGVEKFRAMFRSENDSDGLRQMDDLMAAMDEAFETGQRMVTAYVNDGLEGGNRVMEEFDGDTSSLAKAVTLFQQSQVEEANEMAASILAASDRVKTSQAILGGIALLLGCLIAIFITTSITRPLALAVTTARAMAVGDMTVDIRETSRDETGQLLAAMKEMVASNKEVAEAAGKIAAGDLEVKLKVRSDKDILIQSLSNMVGKLKEVILGVKFAIENVSAGAQAMSASSEEMSQGASEQAAAAEEASSSVEEMTANIRQNADNAIQTEKIAQQAASDAQEGGDAVDRTVGAMKNIAEKIMIIEEIARQTNLLALNAASTARGSRWSPPKCASWPNGARSPPERSMISQPAVSTSPRGPAPCCRVWCRISRKRRSWFRRYPLPVKSRIPGPSRFPRGSCSSTPSFSRTRPLPRRWRALPRSFQANLSSWQR